MSNSVNHHEKYAHLNDQLIGLHNAGRTAVEIANILGMTAAAVNGRIVILRNQGLLPPPRIPKGFYKLLPDDFTALKARVTLPKVTLDRPNLDPIAEPWREPRQLQSERPNEPATEACNAGHTMVDNPRPASTGSAGSDSHEDQPHP